VLLSVLRKRDTPEDDRTRIVTTYNAQSARLAFPYFINPTNFLG
jgi:hypothetical protein